MRQLLTRVLLRGGGTIVIACAGLASASALAGAALPPVPTVPTVTAPLPLPTVPTVTATVPLPLPPPPTTPTITATVPLPLPPPPTSPTPVPIPTVPTPPPVPSPGSPTPGVTGSLPPTLAPAPSAGSSGGAAGEPGSSGAAGVGGSSSGTPTTSAAGPSQHAAVGRVAVRRGAKPGTVTIEFPLRRAATIVLTARGPLPSCAIEARVRVQGSRGANAIPFSGKLGRKTLEPGIYVIAVRPSSSTRARRTVVRVTERGADPVDPSTRSSALSACVVVSEQPGITLARLEGTGSAEPGAPAAPAPTAPASAPPPVAEEPLQDVRGVVGVEYVADRLSPIIVALLAVAMMAALVASLGGMVAFLRRRGQSA